MDPTVLGCGRGYFGGLEQHLPRVIMLHAVEPLERPVFGRNELPQIKCPSLARQNPANEHDLDHVDRFDVLVFHALDVVLEPGQLCRFALGQALLFPGGEPHGVSGSEFGGHRPVGIARLGDVEPPRPPPLHGFRKGSVKPGDVGHLAHHGSSALRLLAAQDLRLHAEDLQPQAEMRLDAEEGLAYDDCRCQNRRISGRGSRTVRLGGW